MLISILIFPKNLMQNCHFLIQQIFELACLTISSRKRTNINFLLFLYYLNFLKWLSQIICSNSNTCNDLSITCSSINILQNSNLKTYNCLHHMWKHLQQIGEQGNSRGSKRECTARGMQPSIVNVFLPYSWQAQHSTFVN